MLLFYRLTGIANRLAAEHNGMGRYWLGELDHRLVVIQIAFHTLTS